MEHKYLPQDMHGKLAHLAEECAEVIKGCSKALRFGLPSTNPNSSRLESNLQLIRRELRDVLRAAYRLSEKDTLCSEEEFVQKLGTYITANLINPPACNGQYIEAAVLEEGLLQASGMRHRELLKHAVRLALGPITSSYSGLITSGQAYEVPPKVYLAVRAFDAYLEVPE